MLLGFISTEGASGIINSVFWIVEVPDGLETLPPEVTNCSAVEDELPSQFPVSVLHANPVLHPLLLQSNSSGSVMTPQTPS